MRPFKVRRCIVVHTKHTFSETLSLITSGVERGLVSLHILTLLFFSSVNTGLTDGGEGGGTKAASRGISGSASTTPNIKRTTKREAPWKRWVSAPKVMKQRVPLYIWTSSSCRVSFFEQFCSEVSPLTLQFQHAISLTDLCFVGQRRCPAVQHSYHFSLHSLWYFIT